MIQLVDDGTLDTVLECDVCSERMRYSFDPEWTEYSIFVSWAIDNAQAEHNCTAEVN